jgi:metallo-beta-lactamase family protein
VSGLTLSFLGAAGTVTGSRYLLAEGGSRVLVDCGLFQGLKQLRLRNRAPFPVPPGEVSAVVLTHAHLDHSGYLPVLVRDGFRGRVYATAATRDLCGILLRDAASIQEHEAELANRHGYSRHHPALPLFTTADAERAIAQLTPADWNRGFGADGFAFTFRRAGHILGAANVEAIQGGVRVVFSGDVGRPRDPLLLPPQRPPAPDYLVVESTYGDRLHPREDPLRALDEVVRRTAARGGVLLIPTFAVGRAQTILHHLHSLRAAGALPALPVYVDSPMASEATALLRAHPNEHRLSTDSYAAMMRDVIVTDSVEESRAIDARSGPMIVIAGSGMLTGGRILFHLERFAGDHRNTILITGHQAAGTRGDALLRGERALKMHGRYVPVRAEVAVLEGLSAHADAGELLDWMKGFGRAPRMTFVTHGEPLAADALRRRIEEELGWPARAPEHGETVALD